MMAPEIQPSAEPRASLGRRIISFPLVRLLLIVLGTAVIAIVPLAALGNAGVKSQLPAECVLFVSVSTSLFLVVRFIERRSVIETFFPPREAARDLSLGFAVGTILISAAIGVLALIGSYSVDGLAEPLPNALLGLARTFGLFLLVALFEEMLFRAVIFRLLEDMLGTWLALLMSAALFGFAHLGQPHSSLLAAVAIAVEAGILLGAVYLRHRTLWIPVGLHWAWNFAEGPIFGTAVSGTTSSRLLASRTSGNTLLTGGEFGPEAGLVALALCGAAGIGFTFLAWKNGSIKSPMWSKRSSS